MVKLTRKYLREHQIYNSYDIVRKVGGKLFIDYMPARTGRVSWTARWQVIGIGFQTDSKAHWLDWGKKVFPIPTRSDKIPKLNEAIKWVKDTYNLTISERDVFGDYHQEGTLEKLVRIFQ